MRIYIEEITDTARYHRLKISISEMQFSYSRSNLDFLDRIIINNTVKVQFALIGAIGGFMLLRTRLMMKKMGISMKGLFSSLRSSDVSRTDIIQ